MSNLFRMNNPYFYRPQSSCKRAVDDVLYQIGLHPQWKDLFSQGKMLGVLVYSREPFKYIAAYSGVVNGLDDPEHFFVSSIYDLQNPDDFYLQKDQAISDINAEIASIMLKREALGKDFDKELIALKKRRKELSIALQLEIFSHFDFTNSNGKYKNIVQIFSDAKRSLPPGGAGECAAPRLLQYAFEHGLEPLEIAEFWYGKSPRMTFRVHGQFYPSCIEKCSPILKYMLDGIDYDKAGEADAPLPISHMKVYYEDEYLLVVEKPSGVLSVPGKIMGDSVEEYLHQQYPTVKGPMLVHRLDQSTSGLMLAAKDANTHKRLQQDFETRAIHKEYVACVKGRVESPCGIINLPICPNPDDRPRQIVDFQFGKPAQTYYEVIPSSATNEVTWLRLRPLTGRTHQLRLHLASQYGLGHPIVGDRIYRGESAHRLMLHAAVLEFHHPVTGQSIRLVSSPFPT